MFYFTYDANDCFFFRLLICFFFWQRWLQLRRFATRVRPALIEEFMEKMSIFTSEEMVYIDEAGFVST